MCIFNGVNIYSRVDLNISAMIIYYKKEKEKEKEKEDEEYKEEKKEGNIKKN